MGNEKKYEILLFLRRVLSSNNPDETINLFIEKIISQNIATKDIVTDFWEIWNNSIIEHNNFLNKEHFEYINQKYSEWEGYEGSELERSISKYINFSSIDGEDNIEVKHTVIEYFNYLGELVKNFEEA